MARCTLLILLMILSNPSLLYGQSEHLVKPSEYTPRIIDMVLNKMDNGCPEGRISATTAAKLSIYGVICSSNNSKKYALSHFETHNIALQFINTIPVNWTKSQVLATDQEEYLVIARKGEDPKEWYLGAVTNQIFRELVVDLDFLEADQEYEAIIYTDGPSADYEFRPNLMLKYGQIVNSKSTLKITMTRGGGMAVRFQVRN